MSGCLKCDRQTPRSRLCKRCATDEGRQQEVGDVDRSQGAHMQYRCLECETVYEGEWSDCPDCGQRRRKFLGTVQEVSC